MQAPQRLLQECRTGSTPVPTRQVTLSEARLRARLVSATVAHIVARETAISVRPTKTQPKIMGFTVKGRLVTTALHRVMTDMIPVDEGLPVSVRMIAVTFRTGLMIPKPICAPLGVTRPPIRILGCGGTTRHVVSMTGLRITRTWLGQACAGRQGGQIAGAQSEGGRQQWEGKNGFHRIQHE